MSQINTRADFSFVRYAQCWEDADVLLEALDIRSGGHYISIASGGENSFSILSSGGVVTAVDLSRIQLAVTDLKRAAYAILDYGEFLGFLGVRSSRLRLRRYRQMRHLLLPEHRAIMDAHGPLIERGIIHSGKFEHYFTLFRKKVLPLTHSRATVEQVLKGHPDRTRRERFYLARWETVRYKVMFKLFFSRFVMGRLGRDAEFFRYVEGSVADRIRERVKTGMIETDTGTNPYLHYILTGNYGGHLPHALREENFEKIRRNLEKLTLVESTLEDCVGRFPNSSVAGYNLSDIFEYMTLPQMNALYNILLDRAEPGGRMVYWNMLVPRSADRSLFDDKVKRYDKLAGRLFRLDKAFFYSRLIIEEKR